MIQTLMQARRSCYEALTQVKLWQQQNPSLADTPLQRSLEDARGKLLDAAAMLERQQRKAERPKHAEKPGFNTGSSIPAQKIRGRKDVTAQGEQEMRTANKVPARTG